MTSVSTQHSRPVPDHVAPPSPIAPAGPPVLVSACLLGLPCRYDGMNRWTPRLLEEWAGRALVPVCPEQLGGLPTPRASAAIEGGDGRDVLAGRARVRTADGDVTAAYLAGARAALELAARLGAREALLTARSPSCGVGRLAAGGGATRPGDGVTAALLIERGLHVQEIEPAPAARLRTADADA